MIKIVDISSQSFKFVVQNFRTLKKLLEVYLLGEILVLFFSGWKNKQGWDTAFVTTSHEYKRPQRRWFQSRASSALLLPVESSYDLDTVREAVGATSGFSGTRRL